MLGANGAGKSSLLRIMAGVDDDFLGEAFPADGLRVGYLPQEPALDATKDVRGNVEEGVAETRALLTRFEEVSTKLGEPLGDDEMEKLLEEQSRLQDQIDAVNAWELDRTVELAMDALRCRRATPRSPRSPAASGAAWRCAGCCCRSRTCCCSTSPPTISTPSRWPGWSASSRSTPGTVVAMTHDRYFLDNVAGWILELDRGDGIPWEGNYSSWLEQKQQRLAQEEKADRARQRTLRARARVGAHVAARAPGQEQGAPAGRTSRCSTRRSTERAEKLEIAIPPGPRLGDLVVEADDLSKGYGDRLLIEDLSFKLPRGGIVGVIGPNGAGKTTLFRMIAGQEKPDRGDAAGRRDGEARLRRSEPRHARCGQDRLGGDLRRRRDASTWAAASCTSRAYVASFNFKGTDQQKKVGTLSGGERNRLHLAKMLKSGGNVLLLDEPTNDLDVDTLRALEDALLDFAGCAVVISHDRWFLDRIATHMLAFEGEGKVVWFEGNYADYEADRKRRLGAEADQPHRLRYKRLPRS